MENIKDLGWKDAPNKKAGLGIEYVRKSIVWLANFHATSYAFIENYEGGLGQIKLDLPLLFWVYNDYFNRKKRLEQTKDVANDGFRKLFKGLEDQNPGKKYCDLLEKVIEKYGMWGEFGMSAHDEESYHFKTFCHGDPWFNNMMYKYKDNQSTPEEAVLIDYQMSSYSAPALDLVYFLASSTVGDLRKKYKEHILTLYHTTLMTSLDRLSCNVEFSYEDLVEDVNKAWPFGIYFALMSLPLILADKSDGEGDAHPEEWMEAMNEQDPVERKRKMDLLMEKNNKKYSAGGENSLGRRIADLLDEYLESECSPL